MIVGRLMLYLIAVPLWIPFQYHRLEDLLDFEIVLVEFYRYNYIVFCQYQIQIIFMLMII